MTPDDLIKWHEKRADDASRRGAHTIASKHAKTAHILRAALEPIAPADVAQAARVLLPWLDNYERTVAKPWRPDSVFSKYDECRHGRYMYEDCLNCLEEDLRAIAGEAP